MILLDTNILSAMTQSVADPVLIAWLDRQTEQEIWTTSVSVFEVEFGIALLPDGRRKQALRKAWDAVLTTELSGRVAAFDSDAARAAAALGADRQRAGRTIEIRDTQIAGIAIARRAQLATRNDRHFRDLGTAMINPWTTGA